MVNRPIQLVIVANENRNSKGHIRGMSLATGVFMYGKGEAFVMTNFLTKGIRLLVIEILCLLLVAWLGSQYTEADSIYNYTDSFFHNHYEEFVREEHDYTTNGPDGKVLLYQDPESDTVKVTLLNGTKVYIAETYVDDRQIKWGHVLDETNGISGWIQMEYLEIVYDAELFEKEHEGEFRTQGEGLDSSYAYQKLNYWYYPGGERIDSKQLHGVLPEFSKWYTDESGNEWGYIDEFDGIQNAWVCIVKPLGTSTELVATDTSIQPAMMEVATVIVLLVVALIIVLIVVFKNTGNRK